MSEGIVIPIAGMIFILTVIYGGRILGSLNNYFNSRQLASSDELMEIQDRLDQLDDLEERMRVVEAVITQDNHPLKKKFEDLQRGSPSYQGPLDAHPAHQILLAHIPSHS